MHHTYHTLVCKLELNTHTNLNVERAGHRVPGPDENKSRKGTRSQVRPGDRTLDRPGCALTQRR
jgi:hypothetical protein